MDSATNETVVSMREFLEGVPPGTTENISDLCGDWYYSASGEAYSYLTLPEIMLYCDTELSCDGFRLFASQDRFEVRPKVRGLEFAKYTCKNCSKSLKIFAILVDATVRAKAGKGYKFGELPNFGPPNPPRLITLIRPQRELFVKGRRAENQGMGIGRSHTTAA